MQQDMILILDMGSEENAQIAREIRDLGVYSEIHAHDITKEQLNELPNVRGIILNGGKNRIVDGVAIDVSDDIYSCGKPILCVDHNGKSGETVSNWPADNLYQRYGKPPFTLRCIFAYLGYEKESDCTHSLAHT